MLALAVVVVSRVVIAEPLSAVAHFGHGPHASGECQKSYFQSNRKKRVWSRDAIRPTPKAWRARQNPVQRWTYCVSAPNPFFPSIHKTHFCASFILGLFKDVQKMVSQAFIKLIQSIDVCLIFGGSLHKP